MEPSPEFKPLAGYPQYLIRDDGTILTNKGSWGHDVPWQVLKPFLVHRGTTMERLYVSLRIPGQRKPKKIPVHIAVLTTFVGPKPDGMEGCHNDGNHFNNHVGNLRWDTHVANMKDRSDHGRTVNGKQHHCARLTPELVIEMRTLRMQGVKFEDLAKRFGINNRSCYQACVGMTWKSIPITPEELNRIRSPHGYRSNSCKLKPQQVAEIRQLRKQGLKWRLISEKFGVSEAACYNAYAGKTWSNIPLTTPPG